MKTTHTMDEFEQVYFPEEYARKQREKRIEEVGYGQAMAEEALERVFGKGSGATSAEKGGE